MQSHNLQENFVMLCPFHSSSKLPSEMSELELQKQNRKILASKGYVVFVVIKKKIMCFV